MKSQIIVMLTHNDKTVKDAMDVFDSCKDIEKVRNWGFKDVGLSKDKMKTLVNNMKACGKTTFLEVVSYTEKECMEGAKIAVECGFDYLMGTLYYDSVWEYLKNKDIIYLPFVGKVYGSPSILEGNIEGIINEAKGYIVKGIKGFDLLAYRFNSDPEVLAEKFVKAISVPSVIAGSIDSPQRIEKINEINPWGFTMGSALFNKKFVANGSFRDNILETIRVMDSIK